MSGIKNEDKYAHQKACLELQAQGATLALKRISLEKKQIRYLERIEEQAGDTLESQREIARLERSIMSIGIALATVSMADLDLQIKSRDLHESKITDILGQNLAEMIEQMRKYGPAAFGPFSFEGADALPDMPGDLFGPSPFGVFGPQVDFGTDIFDFFSRRTPQSGN